MFNLNPNYQINLYSTNEIIQKILICETSGTEEEKEYYVDFCTKNPQDFFILLLTEPQFVEHILKSYNLFDLKFTNKYNQFALYFLKEITSPKIDSLFTKFKDFKKEPSKLNFYNLIKTKIMQMPEYFYTVENILTYSYFFKFFNTNTEVKNKYSTFVNFYNFNFSSFNSKNINPLVNYMYCKSETMLEDFIINSNTPQKEKLLHIFASKQNYFSYFLINNNNFFNLIINNDSNIIIFNQLFSNHKIIQDLLETGNIQKIADLLTIKMKDEEVIKTIKQAIAEKYISPNVDKINSFVLNVFYPVYQNIFYRIREQFIDDITFIQELDSRLSKTITITNNDLYNNVIKKFLEYHYLIDINDNIDNVILDTFENTNKKQLDEFKNLFINNSTHAKQLLKHNLKFRQYLHGNDENVNYLFNQPDFIHLIINDENAYMDLNFRQNYAGYKAFQTSIDLEYLLKKNIDSEVYQTSFKSSFDYQTTLQFILVSKMKENFEYSKKIRDLINEAPFGQYKMSTIFFFNNIYLKKLYDTEPNILKIFTLSNEYSKQIDLIQFYNNNYYILTYLIDEFSDKPERQEQIEQFYNDASIGNSIMGILNSKQRDCLIKLYYSYNELANLMAQSTAFMNLLKQKNEYSNFLFSTPFFSIRFMQQQDNKLFADLLEDRMNNIEFSQTIAKIYIPLTSRVSSYTNIINQCELHKTINDKHKFCSISKQKTYFLSEFLVANSHKPKKVLAIAKANINLLIDSIKSSEFSRFDNQYITYRDYLLYNDDLNILFVNFKVLKAFAKVDIFINNTTNMAFDRTLKNLYKKSQAPLLNVDIFLNIDRLARQLYKGNEYIDINIKRINKFNFEFTMGGF